LGKKRPGPEGKSEPGVSPIPDLCGWNDIEDGEALDVFGMVKRQAIRHASSAIMSRNRNLENPRLAITFTTSLAMARFE
jgi:hypothetical protein